MSYLTKKGSQQPNLVCCEPFLSLITLPVLRNTSSYRAERSRICHQND